MKIKLLSFLIWVPAITFSQPSEDPKPVLNEIKEVDISVTVIRSSDIIANPFSLLVELTNSSQKVLKMDGFGIYIPDGVVTYYDVPVVEKKDLKATEKYIIILPFIPNEKGKNLASLSKIPFLPGDYEFNFILNYSDSYVGAEGKNPHVVRKDEKIHFRPPLTSLLAGGIIGSWLLSIFFVIFKLKNAQFDSTTWELVKTKGMGQMLYSFVLFIFGSVVSVITILIIQRVSDLQLPISLKVEDYLGGVVVGMLSIKLGDMLYDMFIKKGN